MNNTTSLSRDRRTDFNLICPGDDRQFRELIELAKHSFNVPGCAIALASELEWQPPSDTVSIDDVLPSSRLCKHTIAGNEALIVLDARSDARFADDPLVISPFSVRFYAGAPIRSADGACLGAICLADTEPRDRFDEEQLKVLVGTAALASKIILSRPNTHQSNAVCSFADATALAIVTTDAHGKITSWNAAAEKTFGYASKAVLGGDLGIIIPQRFRNAHDRGMAMAAASGNSRLDGKAVEVMATHADGSEFPIELSLASWTSEDGLSFGAHIQDITPRKAREEELHDLARTDALTGLRNAKAFRDCIDSQLRNEMSAVLITLDLDGFKAVNDSLGHALGDTLLQTIAVRIKTVSGADWIIGRLGGDEFAILLTGAENLFEVRDVASVVLAEIGKPITIDGYRLRVGASLGIAIAPEHASDADELLVRADLAMFQAKKSGGRTFRLFDRTMGDELTARRAFRDELKQASGGRQWELYYQPQYDLADRRLTGVEALLRWRHPSWGIILPSTFMPVLETHVMAYEVGNWVLEEACRQLSTWRANGFSVPRVSVNLFSAQIYTGSLTERVYSALAANGLQLSDLELEITETIALRHDDQTLGPLFDMIKGGLGVAFDDFGTGFASLSTVQRFPLTRLKIDRSFVSGICENPQSIAVAGGILAIGRALNVDVIAEGIETEAQEARLKDLGCPEGQGFLYGKAVPAWELEVITNSSRQAAHLEQFPAA